MGVNEKYWNDGISEMLRMKIGDDTMWIYAMSLLPFAAIGSSLLLIGTVLAVVVTQPARIRAAGFAP